MPGSDASALPPGPDRDYVRLYTALVKTLETEVEGRVLGDLFGAVRASGESRSLPLGADEEVRQMLARLGLLPARADEATQAKIVEETIRRTAEAVGRTPAQVSVVFRLYASGWYGVLPQPICGSPPRCKRCGASRECDYFNSPPAPGASPRLPPAKRLQREGAAALSDEDLLYVVLGGPRARSEHRELAKLLLEKYGGLRALAGASVPELMGFRGMSETAAIHLAAAAAFHRRAAEERRFHGPAVRSGKDFFDLYHATLSDLKKEVFYVVLLDQKNRILRDERVSEGTLTASLVHPREVFAPAIRESAAAVAFLHNHPSGDSTPSHDDRTLTERLVGTGELVGIRVLDHIIIGDGCYTSFVDDGLL